MALPLTLDTLIASVRSAAPEGPLEQLEEAARHRSDMAELTDALLGHFVDQARRAGCSWTQIGEALGVSKQAAQQKHTTREAPVERMTLRTKLVLEKGVEAAQARGASEATLAHLLLGILAVPECLAAKLLAEHDVTTELVDAEVEQGFASKALPGYSAQAARVITGSLQQALMLGHNYIGTEHLLLSVLVEEEGPAVDLLRAAGLTYVEGRARVVEVLQGMSGT
jgi:ATP-dependent Clp protease ATP-binding subunit ClpA